MSGAGEAAGTPEGERPETPPAGGSDTGATGTPRGGATDTPAERVREVLETLGEAMGLDAEVHVEEDEEGIRGVLEGDDLGLFIGRHGQTIDAVQHLAFKIANRDGARGATRVVVDAAGYRGRREQALHRQADQAAADAINGGRPVALDAMSATERKVVHEHLKDRDDVETYSEGAEPDRHLVVAPLRL